MKISAVQVVLQPETGSTPPFSWRHGLPGSDGEHLAGWLVISTDEGLNGFAYCRRGVILQDIVERRLRHELVGADPIERERLWHRVWELDRIEEFPIYIQGAVDDALWDIGGKIAQLPVYKLLGSFRSKIPAYASTSTFSSISEYLEIADQCRELGFSAIKLHAWGEAASDIKLCEALRSHVGDEMPLMYDGSAGFDLLDAVKVGQALSELNYLWYEEPMREFSVSAYGQLAQRVSVPLLVGETSDGAHFNTADFIASGAAGAVRTGTYFRGGITGSMRTAHLADSYLLRAEVHGGGLANTHLCMAIPNTTYYECLVSSNPACRAREVDEEGYVHAPKGAGMGYEELWSQIEVPEVLRKFM